MWEYHLPSLLFHLPVEGRLSCFQVLDIKTILLKLYEPSYHILSGMNQG